MSHAPSTAQRYYALTQPTRNSLHVSEMIASNLDRDPKEMSGDSEDMFEDSDEGSPIGPGSVSFCSEFSHL